MNGADVYEAHHLTGEAMQEDRPGMPVCRERAALTVMHGKGRKPRQCQNITGPKFTNSNA